MYAYTTFTTPDLDGSRAALSDFVDRLQRIHPLLPLRTVPLEVTVFTPVQSRIEQPLRGSNGEPVRRRIVLARGARPALQRRQTE